MFSRSLLESPDKRLILEILNGATAVRRIEIANKEELYTHQDLIDEYNKYTYTLVDFVAVCDNTIQLLAETDSGTLAAVGQFKIEDKKNNPH